MFMNNFVLAEENYVDQVTFVRTSMEMLRLCCSDNRSYESSNRLAIIHIHIYIYIYIYIIYIYIYISATNK